MTYSAAALAWAAREADRPHATAAHRAALACLGDLEAARGGLLLGEHAPDREIRRTADQRADLMRREVDSWGVQMGAHHFADWLADRVAALGARPFTWDGRDEGKPPPAGALAPMVARAVCPLWWRRQLRRAVVRARETGAMHRGEVCKRRRQVYCTDDTLQRRIERTEANRAMLEATEIEDAAGQVITLAQAAEASTANKAIRRGELMTRIRGCEEWSDAAGMVGLFTTNTAPSRFHPQTMHGGANPKHRGDFGPVQPNTPKDAQAWLCKTWARCRAALARYRDRGMWCAGCGKGKRGRTMFGADLQRTGLQWYGFRVAEPHHDGCPHWHMLLWCKPEDMAGLRRTIRAAWLAENGDELGAAEHRFSSKPLERGGAAGYVAKYISKNIDDAGAVGAEGHRDTDQNGQTDMLGHGKAGRVEAWAAAWGIRQFQALGQPPVTVWRELRRINGQMVTGAHPDIVAAHAAVNRDGARRADWAGYMRAQGGPMVGRRYRVWIAKDRTAAPTVGRYGDEQPPRPLGVEHAERPGQWVLSDRREWKPRGTWAQPAGSRGPAPIPGFGAGLTGPRPTRTRVNNCTEARPRAGFAAWQIERFQRQNGPLRVALADRDGTGGWRNRESQP